MANPTSKGDYIQPSYDFYKEHLHDQLREVEEQMLNYKAARDGIHILIKDYLPEISLKKPLDLIDYKRFVGARYSKENLTSVIREFTSSDGMINKYIIIRYIRTIVVYNGKIAHRRTKLLKLRKQDLPVVLYRKLLKLTLKHLAVYVLKGGSLNLGYGLGKIFTVRKLVKPRQTLDGDFVYNINLGETRKKKAKLLAEGHTLDDLWHADKFNAVIDENMDKGMSLIDAKNLARKDPRCGIPFAVYCNEDFNFWLQYLSPKYKKPEFLKNYKYTPSQDWLRLFQTYAKSLKSPELTYPLRTSEIGIEINNIKRGVTVDKLIIGKPNLNI